MCDCSEAKSGSSLASKDTLNNSPQKDEFIEGNQVFRPDFQGNPEQTIGLFFENCYLSTHREIKGNTKTPQTT